MIKNGFSTAKTLTNIKLHFENNQYASVKSNSFNDSHADGDVCHEIDNKFLRTGLVVANKKPNAQNWMRNEAEVVLDNAPMNLSLSASKYFDVKEIE